MKSKKVLKNRLEVGERVICYDGRYLLEEVVVSSVNKEEKLATLSNQVVCNRYPNAQENYGLKRTKYLVQRPNEVLEKKLEAFKAKSWLVNHIEESERIMQRVQGEDLLTLDNSLLEELLAISRKHF